MDGLTRVYHVVCEALVYAPEEDICSEREMEAYADLANLKNSLEMLFQERGDDICRETPWYTEEWYREDLENALENADVAPTEVNVKAFLEKCRDIFSDLSERNEMLENAAESFAEGLKITK